MISAYNSIFGPNHVYVVDGKSLRSDPNGEFGLLLNHFGLETDYIDFRFDQQKGFHCLAKPVHYCLGDAKGHNAPKHKYATIYDEFPELIELRDLYTDEMLNTYKYINGCKTAKECCQISSVRFQWLREYFC